jgi:hypothetical protein
LFHVGGVDASFLQGLAQFDAACAARVQAAGCRSCGGLLDRAPYPRKPRGELGEAADAYSTRMSFCCRCEGCRRRATPPSLRFMGRKVYIAVLVIVASAAGRTMSLSGPGLPKRVHDVPVRTVRRWLSWWEGLFALGAFWAEAKGFFATPVAEGDLPTSLLERLGGATTVALEKMLRFLAPITTESAKARIAMEM